MGRASWIAVDWRSARLWVIGPDGAVIAEADAKPGELSPGEDEAALRRLLSPYLPETGQISVLVCGLPGAGHIDTPCEIGRAAPELRAGVELHILPGVAQRNPPDVMLGEETQVAGLLAERPDFDGIVCLPGAHTKWVHVSAREIVSFRSFMTGELASLLSGQSTLQHTVADGAAWDEAAFLDAVSDAMSSPQDLTARLFGLRAAALLGDTSDARARLSGLLIGMELAGARPYWLGQNIVLIGAPALSALYESALLAQGVPVSRADPTEMTLKGLRRAHDEARA